MPASSQAKPSRLWFPQGSHGLEASSTTALAWAQRWARIFAKQDGFTHIWLAEVDEHLTVQWLASGPFDPPMPDHLPVHALQDVIQKGEPFTFRDHVELISGGLFPLMHNGQVVGVLGLLSHHSDYFKPDTNAWISALTGVAANELFQTKYENGDRQAEYMIYRHLQASLDVREALPAVLAVMAEILHAEALTALQYQPVTRRFELMTVHGLKPTTLAKLKLYLETDLVGHSYEGNQPVWIADLQDAASNCQLIQWLAEEDFRACCILPLIGHNDFFGVLEIIWYQPQLAQRNLQFLERIAEQIALAMERTSIQRDLRHSNADLMTRYSAMIEGLSRALELRDLETDGHTRRVSLLTMRLVEHIQIPPAQWDAIRQGALLHDIGKIGIPDAILLKPGSLTEQERKVMRQHVIYGYNILAPIVNLRATLDIVLYHHERWDGKGYPHGLKGEQIPMVARLFSVVDVYDALTSDRPYRPAWSRSQALDYLRKQSGYQFDPQVIKFFLELDAGMKHSDP